MELAGSTWILISFDTSTGTIPALAEESPTLTFGSEGEQANRISGSGGCNRYFGSYTLTNDNFSISPLGSTRMACSPERMAQEDRFFQALSAVTHYEISGDALLITYTGGTLRFKATTLKAEGNA